MVICNHDNGNYQMTNPNHDNGNGQMTNPNHNHSANLQGALDLQASCPHPGDNANENTDGDFLTTSDSHVYNFTQFLLNMCQI